MTNDALPMNLQTVRLDILQRLEPIRSLSDVRLCELAALCTTETVGRGLDPFRVQGVQGQSVYLLSVFLCSGGRERGFTLAAGQTYAALA